MGCECGRRQKDPETERHCQASAKIEGGGRIYLYFGAPQAPDRFNPKVSEQTCGIIQKLYETKQIETKNRQKWVQIFFGMSHM